MLKDFKKFLLRGNVVDLAVGVVIGGAFTAVVTGLVAAFVTPLIALIVGRPDFSKLSFTIHHTVFPAGLFVTPLVTFLLVATVVFFLVVLPITKLTAITQRKEAAAEKVEQATDKAILEELKAIRKALAKK